MRSGNLVAIASYLRFLSGWRDVREKNIAFCTQPNWFENNTGSPGRSAGLPVCRSAGLPVCRSAGLPVCRSAGLPVCRLVEKKIRKTIFLFDAPPAPL
jgi:hypothetical protein